MQTRRWQRRIAMAAVAGAVVMGSLGAPSPSYAGGKDDGYYGMFFTIGYARHNRGEQTGVSKGFGVRGRSWAVKFNMISNQEFDNDRIGLMPGYVGDMIAPSAWDDIGAKRTSPEFGLDIDYIYNFNEAVSLYAGPGIYYNGMQDIRISKGGGMMPKGYVDASGVECRYAPSIEAGLQVAFPIFQDRGRKTRLLLGMGYNTERGYTADIGFRF